MALLLFFFFFFFSSYGHSQSCKCISSLLLSLLFCSDSVIGADYRISTASGFSAFVESVNSGSTYSGTTVYVDSDLSLSGTTNPINSFLGVFDGQGHVISNLKISSSSSQRVGLFGYSSGTTIRNLFLDDSCSVKSSYSSKNNAYVGGIIGYCYSDNKKCSIENSVNMASVTFSGKIDTSWDWGTTYYYLYLGGILGRLYSTNYNSYVKNCANYGSVTHSGTNKGYSRIGGVTGDIYGSDSYYNYIYNCFNYGTITHSGSTSKDLYLGGIMGRSYYAYTENSVGAGKISIQSKPSTSYIGSIAGKIDSYSTINYCYYTSDVGRYSLYGDGTPASASGTQSSSSALNSTLVEKLNLYSSLNSWSQWLLNTNSAPVAFSINNTIVLSLSSELILLPDIVDKGERAFSGWYSDESLSTPVSSQVNSSTAKLYGMFCGSSSYTVTLDANGGDASSVQSFHSMAIECSGYYGILPAPTKTGYSFTGWFTESEGGYVVEPRSKITRQYSHTLYAHWTPNKYIVTFDVNKGEQLSKSEKMVTFDDKYGELPIPNRTGYAFTGWFTDMKENVTSETIVAIPSDHTLHAQWHTDKCIVIFVFDNGTAPEEKLFDLNETIKYPEDPVRDGYTFAGWDKNITNATSEKITITAQWTINNYTLTFDFNNGADPEMRILNFSSTIVYPEDPKKEGHSFEWDKNVTTMPAHDLNITAIWTINNYTVIFIFDNGADPEETTLEFEENITYPDEPKREGYTFAGWDSNFTTMPGHDLNITAQWTINNYTLTFIFDNGADPEVRILNFSSSIIYPDDPKKEGHSFEWDKNVTTMPAYDLNITAIWTINSYTASFYFNNGTVLVPEVKTFVFNSTIEYPNISEREGYTFNGWDNNFTTMPGHDLNITAQWTINNYTLTFIFGNGTDPEVRIVEYNSPIDYPNLTRKGYKFLGWENGGLERMPAKNLTVTALWTTSSSSASVGLIVGIVVPMLIILIAIIIVLVLFVVFKKRGYNGYISEKVELGRPLIGKLVYASRYSRSVTMSEDEIENHVVEEYNSDLKAGSGVDVLTGLYPAGYARPTMRDALLKAGISKKNADLICTKCEDAAKNVVEDGKLFDGFTKEDAAAIAMYTYDFGGKEFESNPYRIINRSLVEKNLDKMQKADGLLYLVMTALRKLPRVMGITLYRGVRGEMKVDEGYYFKGNVITWTALSSTSPSMEETKKFLAKGSSNGKTMGTLFIIEKAWGYDIQPYSLFPGEAEILIEPERRFMVDSVIQGEGLTFIKLEMIDAPLILPDKFGDEW